MTLIMSIPCKDGMIIAADRRATQINTKLDTVLADDNADKIHQLDKYTAFVITGNCYNEYVIADDETQIIKKREMLFNANDIIRSFYRSNKTKYIITNYKSLAKRLKDAHYNTAFRLAKENLQTFEPSLPGQCYFQTLFFASDGTELKVYLLVSRLEGAGIPALESELYLPDYDPTFLRPRAYGFFYVYNEIEQGQGPAFDEYREKPIINRLLIKQYLPYNVTIDDGVSLGREILAATYKLYRDVSTPISEPQSRVPPVSKTMDFAIISPTYGFKWLEKGVVVIDE